MIQGGESFRLIVRRGPQPNQTYELNKDITTLGRDITNDIVINDPEVSRHHMRMTRGAGGFTIEDLGSTNGTFINGQRLTGARPLRNGDMIGLGETVTLGYESVAGVAPMETGGILPPGGNTLPGAAARVSPPAAAGVAPMAPASNYQPAQPVSPYAPPSQQQPGTLSGGQSQYSPQGQDASAYNSYSPSSAYNAAPSPAAAGVAPGGVGTGYDYDPYAVREEEPRNTTRWVLIGCGGLALFCCCSTVLGLVAVDTLCLWDRIPLLSDIMGALGYAVVC